jgi:P pilus assembly chaperone PapD
MAKQPPLPSIPPNQLGEFPVSSSSPAPTRRTRRGLAAASLLFALAGVGCTGTLTVDNASTLAIHFVYFSSTSDTLWGPDRLGETEVIAPGAQRTWELPVDGYDVRVQYAGGGTSETRTDVLAGTDSLLSCYGPDTPGPDSAGQDATSQGDILVVNQAGQPIYFVHFSPSSESSWGEDQLGESEVIQPGAERRWSVTAGRYDLKVVMADGAEVFESDFEVPLAGTSRTVIGPVAATPATPVAPVAPVAPSVAPCTVTVRNDTVHPVTALLLIPSDVLAFETLVSPSSDEPLAPGEQHDFTVPPGSYSPKADVGSYVLDGDRHEFTTGGHVVLTVRPSSLSIVTLD